MAIHENPKQVFIAGGGEGGTLREVLSHRSVEKAVMVDLDPDVVNLCRQYLPKHHQGSFEDQRTTLIHQDARGFLQETDERFDVMIMDLVDPLEGGTAGLLYTEEYYQIAKSKLKPNGILVTQSGPAGLLSYQECFTTIFNTLSQVFDNAGPYHVHVPSFQTLWGFTLASDSDLTLHVDTNDFDAVLSDRLNKLLRFYDYITHRNMFALPRFLRDGMRDEKRTNTDLDPVFMV